MRQFTIFYSWQSDRAPRTGRAFIRIALQAAADAVARTVGVDIVVDSDTQGVPGTPPVNETILRKIVACDVFVGDMTFVAETENGKRVPNPNVMAEYGYALSARGTARILLVMNTEHGPEIDLPFDLRNMRHPESYRLGEGAAPSARRRTRALFAERLERNLEAVIRHQLAARLDEPPALPWRDGEVALADLRTSRFLSAPINVSRPRLMLHLLPLAALARPVLRARTVFEARSCFPPDVETTVVEGQDTSQWWSHWPTNLVNQLPNPEARWSVRLVKPGYLEAAYTLGDRIDDDPEIIVEGRRAQEMLVDGLLHLARLAAKVGLGGPALAAATLEGVALVRLMRSRPGGRPIGQDSVGLSVIQLSDPTVADVAQLGPMLDDLWLAAGWEDGAPTYAGAP